MGEAVDDNHAAAAPGQLSGTQGNAPESNAGGFSGPGAWRGEGPGGGVARIGSLASGYGGLDLAVTDTFGGEVAWHAESDPDASRVLEAHWPGVPNLGDLTAADWIITSVVGRNAALRILGNGVVPQQGAHALRMLAADREAAP